MKTITTIGLDIAKKVFQVHGIDAEGQVVSQRQLARKDVLDWFGKQGPYRIGIEACATATYWAAKAAPADLPDPATGPGE